MSDQTIEAGNVARLNLQEAMAEANGFSLPQTFFAVGTPLIEVGRDAYKRSRKDFEAMPPARSVFGPFLDRVAAENRRDVPVRVGDLAMLDDGRITRPNNGGKSLYLDGPRPLQQLIERTGFKEPGAAAKYLAEIGPKRRAREVNALLSCADEDQTAVLRTRLFTGPVNGHDGPVGREVFAAVSERYGQGAEVDTLARATLAAAEADYLPGDARGEIAYDGRKVAIRAVWHTDIAPQLVAVGELFKAGVWITGADDRTSGLRVGSSILRCVCINFTTMEASQTTGYKRHVGSMPEMVEWLGEALRGAVDTVRVFAEAWDRGRSMEIHQAARDVPEGLDSRTATAGAVRGLVKARKLALPGKRGEHGIEAIMGAYDREPEPTRVGIVNAVTRYAHEATQPGPWVTGDLEAQAGRILTDKRPLQYVEKGEVF